MNFKAIPFKAIRDEITRQAKPELAFKNILLAAKKKCPALDWKQFSLEYMDTDINAIRSDKRQLFWLIRKSRGFNIFL